MSISKVITSGLKRLGRAKRIILWVWLVNLGLALILGLGLYDIIVKDIGKSMAAQRMVQDFDPQWYDSFSASHSGLAKTFRPSVVGIGAVFEGLDRFLSGGLLGIHPTLLAVGIFYVLIWVFAAPGFIRAFQVQAGPKESFFKTGAQFFFRFLFIAILAAILYYLIFAYVGSGIKVWIRNATRESVDERYVFFLTLLGYLTVWTLIFLVNLIIDYTKVITVLHNIKIVIASPVRALGFVLSQPGKTMGVYLTLTLLWIVLFFVYWLLVPGARHPSWSAIVGAFLLGQAYVVLRILLRAWYYGSEVVLYQAAEKQKAPAAETQAQ